MTRKRCHLTLPLDSATGLSANSSLTSGDFQKMTHSPDNGFHNVISFFPKSLIWGSLFTFYRSSAQENASFISSRRAEFRRDGSLDLGEERRSASSKVSGIEFGPSPHPLSARVAGFPAGLALEPLSHWPPPAPLASASLREESRPDGSLHLDEDRRSAGWCPGAASLAQEQLVPFHNI